MKFIYKTTFLLLFISSISFANTDGKKHEKSKKISKQYTVSKDAKVAINNRYGNINITTWDKNRVEIDVVITVKGDDLDKVEERLENIDVTFKASNSLVSATTNFEKERKSWTWWRKSNKLNYKINYTVKMPKTNAVALNNDYGNIYLDELFGTADINCDYGKIVVGDLNGSNNSINLDYCGRSTIDFIKNGDLNVDYSKITVTKTEKIRVNTDYSSLKFEDVGTIDFNADYGSISVDNVVNVSGNSDYTGMSFGTVAKNLKISTDYGSLQIRRLEKGFDTVDIDGQYAGIKIGLEEGVSFNFEIDLQYAGFKRDNSNFNFYKSQSKSTRKYYEGKYGNGNSNSRIKIRSQFGGVSIKEN